MKKKGLIALAATVALTASASAYVMTAPVSADTSVSSLNFVQAVSGTTYTANADAVNYLFCGKNSDFAKGLVATSSNTTGSVKTVPMSLSKLMAISGNLINVAPSNTDVQSLTFKLVNADDTSKFVAINYVPTQTTIVRGGHYSYDWYQFTVNVSALETVSYVDKSGTTQVEEANVSKGTMIGDFSPINTVLGDPEPGYYQAWIDYDGDGTMEQYVNGNSFMDFFKVSISNGKLTTTRFEYDILGDTAISEAEKVYLEISWTSNNAGAGVSIKELYGVNVAVANANIGANSYFCQFTGIHDYVCTDPGTASCTSSGTAIFACSECGDSYSDTVDALGHDYVTVTHQPTVAKQGYDEKTCSRCGDVVIENIVTLGSHLIYDLGPNTNAANSTSAIYQYHCDNYATGLAVTSTSNAGSFKLKSISLEKLAEIGNIVTFQPYDGDASQITNLNIKIVDDDDANNYVLVNYSKDADKIIRNGCWSMEGSTSITSTETVSSSNEEIGTLVSKGTMFGSTSYLNDIFRNADGSWQMWSPDLNDGNTCHFNSYVIDFSIGFDGDYNLVTAGGGIYEVIDILSATSVHVEIDWSATGSNGLILKSVYGYNVVNPLDISVVPCEELEAHSFSLTDPGDADCENSGTALFTCVDCDETKDIEVDALGHYYEDTATPATTYKQGKTVSTCSRCGDTKTTYQTLSTNLLYNPSTGVSATIGQQVFQYHVDQYHTGLAVTTTGTSGKIYTKGIALSNLLTNNAFLTFEPYSADLTSLTIKLVDTLDETKFVELSYVPGSDVWVQVENGACGKSMPITAIETVKTNSETIGTNESFGTILANASALNDIFHYDGYWSFVSDKTFGYQYNAFVKDFSFKIDDSGNLITAGGFSYDISSSDIASSDEVQLVISWTSASANSGLVFSNIYGYDVKGANLASIEGSLCTELGGHSYTYTTTATCTEAGVNSCTCFECGDEQQVNVSALGHDYVANVTAPTTFAQGYTTYVCSRCNDTKVEDYVTKTTNLIVPTDLSVAFGQQGYQYRVDTILNGLQVKNAEGLSGTFKTQAISFEKLTAINGNIISFTPINGTIASYSIKLVDAKNSANYVELFYKGSRLYHVINGNYSLDSYEIISSLETFNYVDVNGSLQNGTPLESYGTILRTTQLNTFFRHEVGSFIFWSDDAEHSIPWVGNGFVQPFAISYDNGHIKTFGGGDYDLTGTGILDATEVQLEISFTSTDAGEGIHILELYGYNTQSETVDVDGPFCTEFDAHSFVASWEFNQDKTSATATLTCANCGEEIVISDATITSEVIIPSTCAEQGTTRYKATKTIEGVDYGAYVDVVDVELSTVHTYTADPTWTWNGHTGATATFTCDICGHEENVVADVTVDEEVPSTTTEQGHITRTATVTFGNVEYTDEDVEVLAPLCTAIVSRSVTLTDVIKLNVNAVVLSSDLAEEDPTVYAKIEMGGQIYLVEGVYNSSTSLYDFEFDNLIPDEMTKTIKIVIVDALENAISEGIETTIADYVKQVALADNSTFDKLGYNADQANALRQLAANLLDYGAKAQLYRGVNVDNLADEGIDSALKVSYDVTSTDKEAVAILSESGVSFKEAKLFFADGRVAIRITLISKDIANTTVTIDDNPASIQYNVSKDYYYVEKVLSVTELDDVFTFALSYNGNKLQTVNYSVKSYVYSAINNGICAAKETNFVKALYNYGKSASALLALED